MEVLKEELHVDNMKVGDDENQHQEVPLEIEVVIDNHTNENVRALDNSIT